MKNLLALAAGMIFGLGIAISGMINPAKVINFFDIAGTWDPSLIFVMGGALVTTAIGYRLVWAKSSRPVFDTSFHIPQGRQIDVPLIGGAALFGVGWGISGFCPGGAIPAIGLGDPRTLVFIAAMIIGIVIARTVQGATRRKITA